MSTITEPRDESIAARLEDLQAKAADLLARATADAPADAKALKAELDAEIKPALEALTAERDAQARELEMKGLKEQVSTLTSTIEGLRKPVDFSFGGVPVEADTGESIYRRKSLGGSAEGTGQSFFADVLAANKGDQGAVARMSQAWGQKAATYLSGASGAGSSASSGSGMSEGSYTPATYTGGGYLVPPEISSELVVLREQAAVLRTICSSISVDSASLQIASVTGGTIAAWVNELTEKPYQNMTFANINANVFTAAGLGVISNQLLADARTSIDSLLISDLAKRLATLEEVAFLNGSGSNQPLGILNTSGVNTETVSTTTIPDLLDAIVAGITDVQTNYQGNPSHIVMHPRTWARIVKARESSSPSTYLIGAGETAFGRRGSDALPGGQLFGLPVVLTKNMPTTLGTGSNESRVIVGNFGEALILDRQGITVDQSPHVLFTQNQTVFRAEERVGFTAARYPKAFSVISGTGLAAG
jgi:HK97 family phage major capsid protein